MESNLRPLTLGEILDRTAQLYRSNFLLFAGIFSVYAGAALVLGLLQIGVKYWLIGLHRTEWVQTSVWGTALLGGLILFLFSAAATAAINRAVAWVNLGEPASIRRAYATTLPRLKTYLWLMTLVSIFVCAPLLVIAILIPATIYLVPGGHTLLSGVSGWQSGLGLGLIALLFLLMTLWFVYAILMYLRYALAIPACVLENLKARAAIRRSIELSKGARGRIFLLFFLVILIDFGLTLLTQCFIFILAYKHHSPPGPIAQSVSQGIAFFTNCFVGPIAATGITLFYYDQRVRKEGYDIEWMMQAAGLVPPLLAPEPVSAPEPAILPGSTHD